MSTTIVERSDGRYCAAIQLNGKRRFVYGRSEKEVRNKLKALDKTIATTGTIPNPGRRTVSDLMHAWLTTAELRPKTLHGYKQTLSHIIPILGSLKLSRLEPIHLQRLYGELSPKSRRTAYRAHLLLHKALGLAVLWGWLPANPCDRVVKPRYTAERKDVWSPEETRRFLDCTREHRYCPLWTLAVCTGSRLGELVALRWTDYDEANGQVSISGNLQYVGRKWVEGTPKTRAGERTISLPREAVVALRQQKRRLVELRLKAGPEWVDSGLVFTNPHGGPLQQTRVQNAMQKEIGRLALPKLTPHGLRHVHASLLLSGGLPVPAVAARLGHANPGVTMAVYAHAFRKQDADAARLLSDALSTAR